MNNTQFVKIFNELFDGGSGTGEYSYIGALKNFMLLLEDDCYNYEKLEECMNQMATWLLISILLKNEIITYGTSARHGFLNDNRARELRDYLNDKSVDWLYGLVMQDTSIENCYEVYDYEKFKKENDEE